jgi:hypothetical protein
VFWLGEALAQFLQALKVEVQGFTRILEGLGQRRTARNDLREVGKFNYKRGNFRLILNLENVTAILMVSGCHNFKTSISLVMSSR